MCSSVIKHLRNCQTCFPKWLHRLCSYQQCGRVLISPLPGQQLLLPGILIITPRCKVISYCSLHLHFLMTRDLHLLTVLFCFYTSAWEKYVFRASLYPIDCLFIIKIFKNMHVGWGNPSVVKSMCCLCEGPWAPHTWCIDMHADRHAPTQSKTLQISRCNSFTKCMA